MWGQRYDINNAWLRLSYSCRCNFSTGSFVHAAMTHKASAMETTTPYFTVAQKIHHNAILSIQYLIFVRDSVLYILFNLISTFF